MQIVQGDRRLLTVLCVLCFLGTGKFFASFHCMKTVCMFEDSFACCSSCKVQNSKGKKAILNPGMCSQPITHERDPASLSACMLANRQQPYDH